MENSKLDTSKIVKYLKQVEDAKNEAIAIAYDLEEQKTTSKIKEKDIISFNDKDRLL